MRRYGDDMDKAVQLVFGDGNRVSIAFNEVLEVGEDGLKPGAFGDVRKWRRTPYASGEFFIEKSKGKVS